MHKMVFNLSVFLVGIRFENTITLIITEGSTGTKDVCLNPGIPVRSVAVPFGE